ncbi:MAG: hypothetical protein GTN62_07650 [Gemmatimonadales bacterium]|nr:hypothetical protein [Gemmatimonadales bacterium]NIP07439.1 hypothetical protein [Gemmatimonadales bacterium]NIR00507.1 hypothetical protein [Gemmatimonadales bacterium]
MSSWQCVVAIAALLAAFASPLHSQTIRGQVVDSTTSEPIGGPEVVLLDVQRDTVAVAKSGFEGKFVITAPAGSYTLRVRCLGHRPKEISLELAADTAVTIRLAPLTAPGRS